MENESAKAKGYINAMVEQLKVGDDLQEMLFQRALVAHDAHDMNALQSHLHGHVLMLFGSVISCG